MAKVITLKDIIKYSGLKTIELPVDTLLTPSAKDWAHENGVQIVLDQGDEKAELLQRTIQTTLDNINKSGNLITRNELVRIVTTSLERMGCVIENI